MSKYCAVALACWAACGQAAKSNQNHTSSAVENDATTPVTPPEDTPTVTLDLPALSGGKSRSCGGFDALGDARFDLVDSRVAVHAPKGSSDIPKSYSIMGAPEPTSHESRLILETKAGAKFVVYAREMFQTAPSDFGAAATSYFASYHQLDKDKWDFGKIETSDPDVLVAAGRPKSPLGNGEAVLLLSSLIQLRDNTLMAVDYYVNPKGLSDNAGCQSYALGLAKGMARGSRLLNQAKRIEKLSADGFDLEIELPEGFIATTKPGPDFIVHYVRKLVPLGKYPGNLVIYVGAHPDTSVPQGAGTAVKESGTLISQKVEWVGFRSDNGGVVQATLPIPKRRGLQLQVVEVATLDGAFLDELHAIAGTLRTL